MSARGKEFEEQLSRCKGWRVRIVKAVGMPRSYSWHSHRGEDPYYPRLGPELRLKQI